MIPHASWLEGAGASCVQQETLLEPEPDVCLLVVCFGQAANHAQYSREHAHLSCMQC